MKNNLFQTFAVVELTIDNFDTLVTERRKSEVWAVDFFAPWCGPCVQLAPRWRRLATAIKSLEDVRVGSVDCVAQKKLCSDQGIRSFPSLRLYPLQKSTNIMYLAALPSSLSVVFSLSFSPKLSEP